MGESIAIRDLTFSYQEDRAPAIHCLSGDIPCGKIVAMLGESGVGKSTLLSLMAGVYRRSDDQNGLYKGEIRIFGREPHELVGPEHMSLMDQHDCLMAHLTVKQNILLPRELLSKAKDQANDHYRELVEYLGLAQWQSHRPIELSGGMKTRVAFARAVICDPQCLFLDEPFASLDIQRRWIMYKALRQRRADCALATVLATHDLWEAAILADVIGVLALKDGKSTMTLEANTPPELSTSSIAECLKGAQSNVERISLMLETRVSGTRP